ncbi:MAG TPA: tyrosine--tRNA ligase [Pyrinomonadaceae bacterium]|nr:tyrosine--tRNA ligase [Pyrinomonadaceae bacterium]
MTIDEQLSYLAKGTTEIIRREELRTKLERSAATGKPLRVKLGADPTAPDIHLGHTVVIRKLRAFQELGHIAIFLIGDFTGMIGDPSGKNTTRPQLTREEIDANAETYKQQIFKLLDPEKTVIEFNSRWMNEMGSAGFLRLSSHVTVRQILERDDFHQRLEANRPLALHEVMYPLVMAYDSVALEADVELGGTDQKFNLLMGRNLQREYEQDSQVAVIMPLLEGTDGVQKMSKSLGNYIGINEPPQEIFGKVMSISDDLMWRYYELCTDLSPSEITSLRASDRNPRDVKVDLAKKLVADFHSKADADAAEEEFVRRFRNKETPEDIELRTLPSNHPRGWDLSHLLHVVGLASSKAEARRFIQQGGVYVDGERQTIVNSITIWKPGMTVTLQVGKRKFLRVQFE